jgi:hypothetical protein
VTQRPAFRLSGPVLGSSDPLALAEFYSQLLGWPITERSVAGSAPDAQDWAILRSPTSPQKLEFQYEPYATAPTWPPVARAQQMLMHLDFGVPDLDAATA